MDRSLPGSRQEYGSELPYLPTGELPDPGIEPISLTSSALSAFLILNFLRDFPGRTRLPMQDTYLQSLDQERAPGEGNGNPLQYSCLGNHMDRGTWQAIVTWGHKSDTT